MRKIPKSQKVWKKVEKIGLSSFNDIDHFQQYILHFRKQQQQQHWIQYEW